MNTQTVNLTESQQSTIEKIYFEWQDFAFTKGQLIDTKIVISDKEFNDLEEKGIIKNGHSHYSYCLYGDGQIYWLDLNSKINQFINKS